MENGKDGVLVSKEEEKEEEVKQFTSAFSLDKVVAQAVALGQRDDAAPAGRQREEDLHGGVGL